MSTQVTTALIKELRDRTGIGMGKCRDALIEAEGDVEKAISNLRKAGMASAVKKQGRQTNEGTIVSSEGADHVAFVEVNAETDFVVKNERFAEFAQLVADEAALQAPESLEAFLAQPYSKDPESTMDQFRAQLIQTIGENIQVSRLANWKKASGRSYGIYSHMGGKIITAVELDGDESESELAREIAMHAAAAAPEYLNPESVPEEVIEQEKEIARSQMKGKPAEIIEKILVGKINKFYDNNCLIRQPFIRDDKQTVEQLVKSRAKDGKQLKVLRFLRWEVGQK